MKKVGYVLLAIVLVVAYGGALYAVSGLVWLVVSPIEELMGDFWRWILRLPWWAKGIGLSPLLFLWLLVHWQEWHEKKADREARQ